MDDIEITRPLENLDWAVEIEYKLGMIPISRMHYMCMVLVNNVLTETIVDTGVAHSLIDLCNSKKFGLSVQLTTKHHNFGSF